MKLTKLRSLILVLCGAVRATGAFAVSVQTGEQEPGEAKKPNILMILVDDMGWGDLRSHGNDLVDTPVLDRLAAESVALERFYVSPACAPTRASALTGRYYQRTGVRSTSRGFETMRAEEVTIAEALKQGGYTTGCFGKWHNGFVYPTTPTGRGFDEFLGFCGGFFHNYFDPVLTRGIGEQEQVQTRGYITDVLTDAAIDFIGRHRDGPFFCYVPLNTPHLPIQVRDELFEKYKQRGLSNWHAGIYAMNESIDENVGRLLVELNRLGLDDSTIVIFFSDNGPAGGNQLTRYSGGLRGRKGSVHENGVRVPFFIRWSGHFQAGKKVLTVTSQIDLFDTLLELTGVPEPETPPRDGRSLVSLLNGDESNWTDRMIFEGWGGLEKPAKGAVRNQRFRMVMGNDEKPGLYDIEADPGEEHDLTETFPQVAAEFKAAFDAWAGEIYTGVKSINDRLPIPVGYAAAPVVEIPAPFGFLVGQGLKFSASGWDWEWIENWTRKGQFVWWDIDVVRPGRYEVSVAYTCPESELGSRMELHFGESVIPFTVDKPVEPVEITFPDRFPRWQSNDRKWGRMVLGVADCKEGRTRLEIRALEIAGTTPLDIQSVFVRRVD